MNKDDLVAAVIDLILERIPNTEARDATARVLQDEFGPPAMQSYRIVALVEANEEGDEG